MDPFPGAFGNLISQTVLSNGPGANQLASDVTTFLANNIPGSTQVLNTVTGLTTATVTNLAKDLTTPDGRSELLGNMTGIYPLAQSYYDFRDGNYSMGTSNLLTGGLSMATFGMSILPVASVGAGALKAASSEVGQAFQTVLSPDAYFGTAGSEFPITNVQVLTTNGQGLPTALVTRNVPSGALTTADPSLFGLLPSNPIRHSSQSILPRDFDSHKTMSVKRCLTTSTT